MRYQQSDGAVSKSAADTPARLLREFLLVILQEVMREYIQQHPELNMTQDDIVKSTLTKAERHLKDKSDGRPDKPPPWVTQPARRRRPRPAPPPTVCVPFQERLLHVLRRADVKHEGRAEHGAHGDVQPAVEAAEAGREGRLPETLWTGEAINHKPRKKREVQRFTP